ncbi:MAG: Zn-ribbon domain-containing OB-fold protein [Halioglobus sp.]
MSNKPLAPAIDGWHTMDAQPKLIGTQCDSCGTYFFPKQTHYCKNPNCESTDFTEVELSRSGKVWSYTNACYKPPEPFQAQDPFVPYAIAAIELEKEQMVILGQVIEGVSVEDLKVGMPMELVLEPLHETDEDIKVTWKWRPQA